MSRKIFFARKNYLELLQRRVSGLKDNYRQNIAIIGDELVGKTALIFEFLARFQDNRIICLYIEARPESLDSFAKRFIGILLYSFLSNSGILLREDLEFLIIKASKYAPKTTERIRIILQALSKRRKSNIFAELNQLCELMYQETGKSSVVIFDEFQNLEAIGFLNLYREWSRLLIANKNTMYIILSSAKCRAQNILSKNLSLLFGNFEVITVDPFDINSSDAYIRASLGQTSLSAPLRNFIVHFTGGSPMYLDAICTALRDNSGIGLAEILQGLLFDSGGILNQRFSNRIRSFFSQAQSNDYLSILYLVSSGRNRIKDIAHFLRMQKKELYVRLSYLLEADLLSRSGDFLRMNDRVFGFWMRFVYQERLQSLTFDAKNQKTKFRDSLEALIQDFILNSRKSLEERMNELLCMFEDEMLQIERKKIRLNHFREIKPLQFGGRMLNSGLLGRSHDSLWIVALKADQVSEEDVMDFSRECRKYRHKLQRKIIVSLKDIDTNTRLRALEEKIWTWDINNLNQILDLYSKPRVIA